MRGVITDANHTRNFETIGDMEQDSQFLDDNLILNIP
jgi:hypothetical protein